MKDKSVILFLEDVAADFLLVEHQLRASGLRFEAKQVQTKEEFAKELEEHPPDLILSDHGLHEFDAFSALALAKAKLPGVPFIFVTGSLGEAAAARALKSGATDYVLKSDLQELGPAVTRALRLAEDHKPPSEGTRATDPAMLTLAIEAAGLGTWDYNPQTGETTWSDRCKAVFGLPPDAPASYEEFLRRIHPEDRERVETRVRQA